MEIGKALKLLRRYSDLKACELAERTGISQSYLSELETGKKIPNLSTLKKLEKVLGVRTSVIIMMAERIEEKGLPKKKEISDVIWECIKGDREMVDPLEAHKVALESGVEPCPNCAHDLTIRCHVKRRYTDPLGCNHFGRGHYDQDGYYIPDEDFFWDDRHYLTHQDEEYCERCNAKLTD